MKYFKMVEKNKIFDKLMFECILPYGDIIRNSHFTSLRGVLSSLISLVDKISTKKEQLTNEQLKEIILTLNGFLIIKRKWLKIYEIQYKYIDDVIFQIENKLKK